jgi:D-glycero-beta-D-manno-heptose 1-phosphate adenylyltransferase
MAEVILQHGGLAKRIETLKSQGKKVVLADGCFDLLHVGHVRFLRAAKSLGDVLILALRSDKLVKNVKGPGRPLLPLEDRLEVLSAFEMIDFVTVFEDTVKPLLAQLNPQIYAKCAGAPSKEEVSFGGRVVIVKEGEDHTAEKLIQEILRKYGPLPKTS